MEFSAHMSNFTAENKIFCQKYFQSQYAGTNGHGGLHENIFSQYVGKGY